MSSKIYSMADALGMALSYDKTQREVRGKGAWRVRDTPFRFELQVVDTFYHKITGFLGALLRGPGNLSMFYLCTDKADHLLVLDAAKLGYRPRHRSPIDEELAKTMEAIEPAVVRAYRLDSHAAKPKWADVTDDPDKWSD